MLFNSAEFLLLFLPLTLLAFYTSLRLNSSTISNLILLLSSFIFYSYWDSRYLVLLCMSILVNYAIGEQCRRSRSRPWLMAGIGFNLSLIALFKYADWFLDTVNTVSGAQFTLWHLALPLGISFFTFQQIAYLVDCFHDQLKQRYSLLRYSVFVSFFPQLIAGPIVHHKELMPQLTGFTAMYCPSAESVARGLFLILVGLVKKLLIADGLAMQVDPVFAHVDSLSSYDAWVATLGYSFQLYFDFSAYCEIAMGIALLFGIQLPINFNSPYKAHNIQDFWRRWHITLGRFLRQYIYIPLGGNRHGYSRTMVALIITMVLGGLWHGAGWNFILWGCLHGAYLAIYYLWSKTGLSLPHSLSMILTFLAVTIAWTLFRCQTVDDAVVMYEAMFHWQYFSLPASYKPLFDLPWIRYTTSPFFCGIEIFYLIGLYLLVIHAKNVHEYADTLAPSLKHVALTTGLAITIAFNLGSPSSFLYWQF